jgi:hypothetical protein
MNNTKKGIYLSIKEEILQNTAANTVGLFNSQFDNQEQENTFAFPAAFIEFLELIYTNKGEGVQDCDATVRIHLGFDSLKTEDLRFFDFMEEVNLALQGFTPVEDSTPLNRFSEAQDPDHGVVGVYIIDYRLKFRDASTHRNKKLIKTENNTLELKGESSKPMLTGL